MIEPGWNVVATDGAEIGRVEEVVGDTGSDIFNGLAVSSGLLGKAKYVPAERVVEIREGEVLLDLPPEAIDDLEEHEPEPPSTEFRA
ncbi:MAG TPA: PRC-barrel domain-containing protein [Gaiellaceae bacterium]|nr:PRC-barrel domain-containing protein [Gaiellaceae bacterium]